MTSTSGVTLISLIAEKEDRRRLPRRVYPPFAPPDAAPMPYTRSSSWREMIAENSSAKFSNLRPDLRRVGGELIVEDCRRYGSKKAKSRRKERFGDARRHHRKIGVLRIGDGLERGHDAPDGAEQADEGRGRADRRQEQKPRFDIAHFLLDLDVHDLFDALLHALEARARRRSPGCASIPAWRP